MSDGGIYGAFLDGFCGRDEGTVREDEGRLCGGLHRRLRDEEVEGECVDLCAQYLGEKCPKLLAACVAREVVNEILSQHLGSTEVQSNSIKDDEGASKNKESDGIDSGWLAQTVVKIVRETCTKWKTQIPSEILQHKRCSVPDISEHSIKNTRRKMEDRHVVMPYLSQLTGLKTEPSSGLQFYAVYDGHGGIEAAKYAAVHLHFHLAKSLRSGRKTNDAFKDAFKDAFSKTDQYFVDYAKQENIASGSTAICAIIEEKFYHIAWLGDSQAVLIRKGEPVKIMDPHKPEREDEKQRIQELGGYVVWFGAWRVNGNLSVSRAIGDANFKPFICADPDITSIAREPSDEYLVLACDGLWDTLKYEELASEIEGHLRNGNNRSGVARHLIEVARDRGSSDNITVIVVFLRDGAVSKSEDTDDGGEGEKAATGKDGDSIPPKDGQSQSGSSAAERETGRNEDAFIGGDNSLEGSRLMLEMKGVKYSTLFEQVPENLLENDSSELESSEDVHVLSADSAKNILDPLRVHSSDDTNGQNISGETDYGAVCYESSPLSNPPRETSHDSEDSLSPDSQHLEGHSDASSTAQHVDAAENSQRPRRRRQSANHRSRKENRRPHRHDKVKATTPPCIHSISADRKQLDTSFRDSCRSLSQASGHLVKMLAGFGARNPPQKPNYGYRSTNKDRWTIAVEVEDWATMFESNKPIATTQGMNLSTHW